MIVGGFYQPKFHLQQHHFFRQVPDEQIVCRPVSDRLIAAAMNLSDFGILGVVERCYMLVIVR